MSAPEPTVFKTRPLITGIVIGAGGRGQTYSSFAVEYPEKLKIVGVAEPNTYRRQMMKKRFNLSDDGCFKHWNELSALEKVADCVFICTQDQDHAEPAIAMAKKGYHILLEKPMAVTPEDCRAIVKACVDNHVKLTVCHVLRYHPCVRKLKEVIDSGVIGDVVNISHTEPVGFWHFAHSFVRGNWGNTSRSTFSLLSKCCHDVDLISYWMGFKKCIGVSSFGSLHHFRKENKPKGASTRCLDCTVERTCPYSAKKIYLDPRPTSPRFPMRAVCDIEDSIEGYLYHLEKALEKGPYGQCVYDTDNDVCDNQVVNFKFEDESTASLTMIAFSQDICSRKTIIYGTKGQLKWDDLDNYEVHHFDFLTKESKYIKCDEVQPGGSWGHGGSDFFTINAFVESITKEPAGSESLTGPNVSLASHLLAFAAEHSRITGQVVNPSQDPIWRA